MSVASFDIITLILIRYNSQDSSLFLKIYLKNPVFFQSFSILRIFCP